MALEKEEEASQNAAFCVLDGLYCEEETGFVEEDLDGDLDFLEISDASVAKFQFLPLLDMFSWDDDELLTLISKENETNPCFGDETLDGFLVSCRKESLDWVFRVKSHYGFSSLTAILAVNYFDRFMTSIKLQTDTPWMSQLVAVACLSLAAKVEEIQVPLLLDLQVEEARYVFEAKTIQRMELLILSTLQWRMHPVTPISFFDHIIRRFGSESHQQLDFFRKCERLLISVVADTRFMSYLPSVLATAIMIYVIKDLKSCDEVEYQSQIVTLLKVNQEKVNECYELLLEHHPSKKRMVAWPDQDSPSGIFDFDDSSNGSWVVSTASLSSSSSSPEPLLKRRRVQEQQMRLPSINQTRSDETRPTGPYTDDRRDEDREESRDEGRPDMTRETREATKAPQITPGATTRSKSAARNLRDKFNKFTDRFLESYDPRSLDSTGHGLPGPEVVRSVFTITR